MPIFDHDAAPDPNRPARCPRQLLGEGPRCRALVLVRDADEHERWHDRLDEVLQQPVDVADTGVRAAAWPGKAPVVADPAGFEPASAL